MTRVNRIDRLQHPGVLRDFTWPTDLPEFGRYNLIYGWNGTGKTIISKLFRALELRKAPEGDVALTINNVEVDGDNFITANLPVRVFNRDFIAESVFPIGGGDVQPIFVLGKESAEKQAEIEQLNTKQTTENALLESAKQKKDHAERGLDRHCIDRATVIRDTLRSSGNNSYNNYDKARYRKRAESMLIDGNNGSLLLADDERERLLTQCRATPKPSISAVQHQVPDFKKYEETVLELLQKSVVSSAIDSIKADSELSSWTRQGLGLHRERHTKNCLFCEQPLPDGRITNLEAHFNTEYEKLLKNLNEQIERLAIELRAIDQAPLPNRAEFYEDLAADYESAQSGFIAAAKAGSTFIGALIYALEDKKKRLFEAVPLEVSAPAVETSFTDAINMIIRQHNEMCDDFESLVSSARQKLETDSIAGSLDEYQNLVRAVSDCETTIGEADVVVQQFIERITHLTGEIIDSRQPAEELNENLHKYLGHAEIKLEVKETGYAITRNGVTADSLSEGEITAIALLYFLKSLDDRSFELAKGVVVLDDPVSSLDANALFLAFGFIRQCTEDAAQVFILTHNFSMFRQVRNWFHNLPNQRKRNIALRPARFYMMECALTDEGRRSSIKTLDSLLEQFESEYQYLFARIYRRAQSTVRHGMEANYIFPNMARRLLEAFLAFRRPNITGLSKKLKDLEFEEYRKLRILRFLHTHSHGDAIIDPEHDPSALGEAQAVLTDLLDLIKQEDTPHYDAMVALVSPANDEGDDD